MSFFSRGSSRGGNRGRRGRFPNTFWQPGGHKKLRFSIHFDVDSDEFQQLIQTGHLNLGGQHALPQPQVPPNVILQPHPGIVNVPESHVQPHNDGWGGIPANPSSGINQWPIDPLLLLLWFTQHYRSSQMSLCLLLLHHLKITKLPP
jgi:hypothetical protein